MLTFINFRPAFAILAAYNVSRRETKEGREMARNPATFRDCKRRWAV